MIIIIIISNTNLNLITGPADLKISFISASVESYGTFPTNKFCINITKIKIHILTKNTIIIAFPVHLLSLKTL